MSECPFCAGKAVKAEYCGQGIKTISMMLSMMFGPNEDEEQDYANNGIMLKNGNQLCFDNSAGEYAELSIEIKNCPFCGKSLKARGDEQKGGDVQ